MKKAFLISFGLGGHSVEAADNWKDGTRVKSHISGYDSPESFERALERGEKESYPPLSAVPVLDKRAVLQKKPGLSFRSPLVDVDLADDVVDRIDTRAARNLLPGLSGGFDTLAASAIAHEGKPEPGPLDSVSLAAYIRWWTERGARLGHMDEAGTRIVWDDTPYRPDAPARDGPSSEAQPNTHKCTVCKRRWLPELADVCPECFESLEEVRIVSPCGPCLSGYRRVRTNRTTITVAHQNGRHYTTEREPKHRVHTEPCPSCMDHPRTQYPDGYMD